MKEVTVILQIDTTVPPVAQKHRRVPFHLGPIVEKELKQLIGNDLLDGEATDWISPIVMVPKPTSPGEYRLSVDMVQANKAIKRVRHVIPTIESYVPILMDAISFARNICTYDIPRRGNLFCKQNRVAYFPFFLFILCSFVFTQNEFTVTEICDDNNVGT